ncbi:MAG: twin-arginine translocase TatA/TatE family subunit [Actinomycetota bacterium]|nr:twin-arginine translocase TatA/TatE family subunit [Actinomycetota bacterium]
MLDLSPEKLLIILVVAVIVLGPDKLPRVARQVGSLWSDLQRLRQRLESEVRGTFPDLPSTDTITRAVRSPMAFLDQLGGDGPADSPSAGPSVVAGGAEERRDDGTQTTIGPDLSGGSTAGEEWFDAAVHDTAGRGRGMGREVRVPDAAVPDDPSMN